MTTPVEGEQPAISGGTIGTGDPPYLWSDLLARRNALALHREDLAVILKVDEGKYAARESGALAVGPNLVEELIAMEEFVADLATEIVDDHTAAGAPPEPAVLSVISDQHEFEDRYPDARTLRDEVPWPVSLQHVAVGRAVAILERAGRHVEVYRSEERRADLTVRRLAAGMDKNGTAALLGVQKKHYYRHESGVAVPPAGILDELRAINNFIETTAAKLEVVETEGITAVLMNDDQHQFETSYPQARTLRDQVLYPRRVMRVAAARRASQIEAAGGNARIVVIDG